MPANSNTEPKPATPEAYIASLPEDRKTAMTAIRKAINKNIPKGFEERICSARSAGRSSPLFPAGIIATRQNRLC